MSFDPFILSANAAGFASQAVELCQILTRYITETEHAASDAKSLLNAVKTLTKSLGELDSFLKENGDEIGNIFHEDSALVITLDICKDKLIDLLAKFRKYRSRLWDKHEWPFEKNQFVGTIQALHQCSQTFNFALNIANCNFLSETLAQLQEQKQKLEEIVDIAPELLARVDSVSNVLDLLSSYPERVKRRSDNFTQDLSRLLPEPSNWLSPLEPFKRHKDIKNARYPNTGNWLLHHETFLRWLNYSSLDLESNNRVLCCYGIPGAGKTFVSSVVIDHVTTFPHGQQTPVGVAYVYCDYRDQDNQTCNNILGCFLHQLLCTIKCIPEDLLNSLMNHAKQRKNIERDEIVKNIKIALQSFHRNFICIDAIDELTLESRKELVEALNELLYYSSQGPQLQIYFTGRPDVQSQVSFLSSPNTAFIEVTANENDIRRFLHGKLNEDPFPEAMNDKLKDEILKEITKQAQGMFLLPALQFQSILEHVTPHLRRKALSSFSRDLPSAFDATISRIQRTKLSVFGMRVLTWVHLAKRPLKIKELLHALAVRPGDIDLIEDNMPSKRIVIDCCLGLVLLDEETSTFRLTHYLLEEFLRKHTRDYFVNGYCLVAQSCLTYLTFKKLCKTKRALKELPHEYALLEYAACNWGHHLPKDEPCCRMCKDLALKLVRGTRTDSSGYCATQILYEFQIQRRRFSEKPKMAASQSFIAIHAVAYFGVVWLLEEASLNVDLNLKDGDGLSALSIASMEGHDAVVRWLLAREDVDVSSRDNYGYTPLSRAAEKGHNAIVQLLLSRKDIDINSKTGHGLTPLSLAAENGHGAIVQLLLSRKDIDINSKTGHGLTPLSYAAKNGHEATVKLLLSHKDIDINSETGHGLTPLSFAAENGHGAIVKVLLPFQEPNVHFENNDGSRGVKYGAALHAAAYKGHEELVEILLEAGAEVNTNWGEYGTALQAAACQGHAGVVRMLLKSGANVNTQGGKYGTALQAAACGKDSPAEVGSCDIGSVVDAQRSELVDIFLDAGADVNVRGGKYGTALQSAIEKGRARVVRALLDGGANVNGTGYLYGAEAPASLSESRDDRSDTENDQPIETKSPSIKQFLVEDDKKLSATMGVITPLSAAVTRGHVEIVKLLLDRGADPNAMLDGGLPPLRAVLELQVGRDDKVALPHRQHQMEVIKHLLAAGAGLHDFDWRERSCALLAEAIMGHLREILEVHFDHQVLMIGDQALLSEGQKRMAVIPLSISSTEALYSSCHLHIVGNEMLIQLLFRHTFPKERLSQTTKPASGHFSGCPHLDLEPAIPTPPSNNTDAATERFLNDPVAHYEQQDQVRERVSVLGGLGWICFWPTEVFDNVDSLSESVPDLSKIIGNVLTAERVNDEKVCWILALLLGAYSAALDLQKNQFCCISLPLLVECQNPSNQIEVVQVEIENIRSLILKLQLWRCEGLPLLEDKRCSSLAALWQQTTELLTKLNIASSQLMEPYPDGECILYFLTLAAKCLCAAVHLCASSYAGDLDGDQFAQGHTLDEGMILLHGDSQGACQRYPQLVLHKCDLSCLGDMLGGPVWAFKVLNEVYSSSDDNTMPEMSQYNLLAKLEDVVELWGAGAYIWETPQPGCDPKLTQVVIGGGRIVGLQEDPSAGSISSTSVMAYWVSHADADEVESSASSLVYLPTKSKVLLGYPDVTGLVEDWEF